MCVKIIENYIQFFVIPIHYTILKNELLRLLLLLIINYNYYY